MIALSPVAQGIYDSVMMAMQEAEEMGGPEGAEYVALMQAIRNDASERIHNAASAEALSAGGDVRAETFLRLWGVK